MPIWLRKFTFNKLKEWYDAQNKEKGQYLINEDAPATQVQIPDVVKKLQQNPTYNVKTSKKK